MNATLAGACGHWPAKYVAEPWPKKGLRIPIPRHFGLPIRASFCKGLFLDPRCHLCRSKTRAAILTTAHIHWNTPALSEYSLVARQSQCALFSKDCALHFAMFSQSWSALESFLNTCGHTAGMQEPPATVKFGRHW